MSNEQNTKKHKTKTQKIVDNFFEVLENNWRVDKNNEVKSLYNQIVEVCTNKAPSTIITAMELVKLKLLTDVLKKDEAK